MNFLKALVFIPILGSFNLAWADVCGRLYDRCNFECRHEHPYSSVPGREKCYHSCHRELQICLHSEEPFPGTFFDSYNAFPLFIEPYQWGERPHHSHPHHRPH